MRIIFSLLLFASVLLGQGWHAYNKWDSYIKQYPKPIARWVTGQGITTTDTSGVHLVTKWTSTNGRYYLEQTDINKSPVLVDSGYVRFDGSNDYLQDPIDEFGFTSGEHSIAVWLQDETTSSDGYAVTKGYPEVTYYHGWFLRERTSNLFGIAGDVVKNAYIDDLTTNIKFIIGIISWEDSKIYAYLNGNLVNSEDISGIGDITSPSKLRFGASGAGRYYKGKIYKVEFYDKKLTEREIIHLYHVRY